MSLLNVTLPPGMRSISILGEEYTADETGAVRGIESHVVAAMQGHDPRIATFVEDGPQDPGSQPGAGDRKIMLLGLVAKADRKDLFSIAKQTGLLLPANFTTDDMREKVTRHVATLNGDDLPDGARASDRNLEMLAPSQADLDRAAAASRSGTAESRANRGNLHSGGDDPRGSIAGSTPRGLKDEGHGTKPGATFSQPGATGEVIPEGSDGAAIRAGNQGGPSPSGLGQVTPTGTEQPPFNQLSTETGKPADDATKAPFPISVPPIDPNTGLPYKDVDARVPETAKPAIRQEETDDARAARANAEANKTE